MRFGARHVADRRVGIGALSNSFVAASRTLEFARRCLHHATLGCYTSSMSPEFVCFFKRL
jgi:hypothetical protein